MYTPVESYSVTVFDVGYLSGKARSCATVATPKSPTNVANTNIFFIVLYIMFRDAKIRKKVFLTFAFIINIT